MSDLAVSRTMRVLIALDPAAPAPGVAEAVSALTSGLNPELTGLFVEDDNLMRLCGLPFAREVTLDTGLERALSLGLLESQLRIQRARMERLLARTARQLRLPHRFQVARGELREELRRAAARTDLFLVGQASGIAGARSWMGWRLHELVSMVPGTLAIIHEPWKTGRSIIAALDDEAAAHAVLTIAARLALGEGIDLIVAFPGSVAGMQDRLSGALARMPAAVRVRWLRLDEMTPERLARLARTAAPRAMVLGAGDVIRASQQVEALLAGLRCSVLTVRPELASSEPGETRTPAG
jgi:hypothetical protein